MEEWAKIIKEILGQKEVVAHLTSKAEEQLRKSNILRHLVMSIRRRLMNIPHPWWESIGGISYNHTTNDLVSMGIENVPTELQERAMELFRTYRGQRTWPNFEQKALGTKETYWIVSTSEIEGSLIAFYRRPKMWI